VEVSARREAEELGAGDMQRVGSAEMERSNASTVADAVRNLPGVSLSRNNRNEEMISLRGFDSRQVPIFVDGVPLYVPYDGYVDLGRFTTFDLAEINGQGRRLAAVRPQYAGRCRESGHAQTGQALRGRCAPGCGQRRRAQGELQPGR
jgi:hypothetical protein